MLLSLFCMMWFFIVLLSISVLMVSWCTYKFRRLPLRKRRLAQADRVLLITAHPDDECMFFGPFIRDALAKWKADLFILCLSTGNHYGAGTQRGEELKNACDILGIPRHNIELVDDPLLPDNPLFPWEKSVISTFVTVAINRWKPSLIVTFDEQGVSGHRNHCDLSRAVLAVHSQHGSRPKAPRLFLLQTVNVVRKYTQYLDFVMSLYTNFDFVALTNGEESRVVARAMSAHVSQMMWFRWLYIRFSRYLYINTFREVPRS